MDTVTNNGERSERKPTTTRIQCGSANCFIAEENGSAILIDTATVHYCGKVQDACKNKNIRLIVLTHGHVDHIQNAAALSKVLGAPIAMHKADAGLIENQLGQPVKADSLQGKLVLALTKRNFQQKIEPFVPDVLLDDGDSLAIYGVNAKIVGLPGHTKGSIGVLAGNEFFVGDALMHASKSLLYGDKAEMEKSAERISSYKPVTVHFGHGKSAPNRIWR